MKQKLLTPTFWLIAFLLPSSCFTQQSQKKVLRTIVIDPGHGGIDPGARGSFSTEAEVSLAVSMKL